MAVADIIASQQAYADSSITGADSFLSGLLDLSDLREVAITDLPNPGYLSRDSSELSKLQLLALQPSSPTITPVSGTLPTFTPAVISDLETIPVPDFGGVRPSIDIPAPPSSVIPTAPDAPTVSDPVIPSAPTVSLPTAPTVNDITVPAVPVIAKVVWGEVVPIPTRPFWLIRTKLVPVLDATLNGSVPAVPIMSKVVVGLLVPMPTLPSTNNPLVGAVIR